jgi:ankyrin repeat protein
MPARSLPLRPSLNQLKLQAHELHRAHRDGEVPAAARIATHHPRMRGVPLQTILDRPLPLADAQLVVAREYGFETWSQLKQRVELGARMDRIQPHPRFEDALAALDAGDPERLRGLLASHPDLVHARTDLEPPFGYFSGATLLHHVAGNPWRDRDLPANIVDLARLLLDAGAEVDARTLGPSPSNSPDTRGATTMGLVITSRQASERSLTGPLVDLLLAHGASLDLTSEDALDASLTHHAPRAAEKMIELGARPDLFAAAALGRMDRLRGEFDGEGRLRSRPRRHGREMSDRDAIGLALLYAYVRKQPEAVDFLLQFDGNWNVTGVANGTALHRAAWSGDLEMVERLVARGADVNNRDNPFGSTPLGWAHHNNQAAVVTWLQQHAPIDIHDAVAFDLRDQVEARIREDPSSVNVRLVVGSAPGTTPLHVAAHTNNAPLARLLYEKGGFRDALDGHGKTPLDVADAAGAGAVVKLLDERGAWRAADAPSRAAIRARPLYRIDRKDNVLRVRPLLEDRDWGAVIAALVETRITGLDASGQMTDAILERIARLDFVTRLELGGSTRVTDAGVRHLARLRHLQRLDLSGTGITDHGLAVLRDLSELRTLRLHHEAITDSGGSHVAHCHRLERVEMFPGVGPLTLRALAGQQHLRHLRVGRAFEEADLALLHDFPAFKSWQGGQPRYGLMDYEAEPTYLMAYPGAPYTRNGLAALAGLDGLFALNLDNPVAKNASLAPLTGLPHLGWLGYDATDESMREIAALPHLRQLMAQDTRAGDDGFIALSRSATIEYIWGRRCHNLTGRGFAALSSMPSLRGLSVSCKNVDDAALSTLPRFPALRELMPMDVPDAGFRHVGRCEQLEALWCMYCRDTTDAATEHVVGLSKLKTYYAGRTKITDRSLEILRGMPSLETLHFWSCSGITNAGVAELATLPRLRQITIGDCRRVTEAVAGAFPDSVRVDIE